MDARPVVEHRGIGLAAPGPGALDQVLDSYEATLHDLDLKDARFRIVHAGLSTPAIQKRLRALNVGVDGNPPFV